MMGRVLQLSSARAFPWLVFGLLGIAGLILILLVTPWGIGVSHDSVFYLDAAENALAGKGLRWQAGGGELRPLTHYPPFYSLLLAGVSLFGFDFVESARVLAAALFALNLVWTAWLVLRHSRSWSTTFAASMLALTSPILLDVHLMALSEPLFIFLLLATISALTEYLGGGQTRLLVAAGALAGLANLTRYAGLSLTGTALFALILFKGSKRQKAKDFFIFAALSLAPLALWYGRNLLLAGTPVGRVIMVHPPPIEKLKLGAQALYSWLLPPSTPFLIGNVIFATVLIIYLVIFIRQARSGKAGAQQPVNPESKRANLVHLTLLYILIYAVFLMLSLTFVDASTPLDTRILSPAYVCALLAAAITLKRAVATENASRGWVLLQIAIWTMVLLSYVPQSWQLLSNVRLEGRGFTARLWEGSELIAKTKQMEPGAILYSSDALRLYFLTGRPVFQVPEKINPVKASASPEYASGMNTMREALKTPGSALVLFSDSFALYRPELPKIEEVTQGLVLFWQTRHGVIYVDPVNARGGDP